MTGSIQKKINQENLMSYPVLAIPENLLASADSFISVCYNQIKSLRAETKELTTLRDWLLPTLMNGQAVVG